MKQIKSLFFLLILFILNGCTLYQKPKIAPLEVPKHFKIPVKITNKNLKDDWWNNFHDNQLNQLVAWALKENLNYQIAIKNIQISQTYVTQAASALLPQVNLNFDATRIKLSRNAINTFGTANNLGSNNPSVPLRNFSSPFTSIEGFLSASYELDVWNQIHNSVNQAKANTVVSAANSDVIKLTLISDVVNTYFQIVALNTNLANLRQQIYFSNEQLKLTASQFRGGLVDAQSIDDVKIQIESIKINISSLEKQKIILLNSMAYLLGQYPEHFNFPINSLLTNRSFLGLVPKDIPSAVLSRRPDIRGAFYQVVAYGYLEKQNIANFLPSFNLTGNYGFSSPNLKNFLSSGSVFWNYGTNILQPIFDFGLRMSEYKRSKYQFEAAFLNYKNTVINSISEVDNALSSYQKDYLALQSYQHQSALFKDKLRITTAQYKSGLADDSSYLTTSLTALQTNYNLANQQFLVLQDIVQVYKTLGLGLSTEHQPDSHGIHHAKKYL
ncbi:outer membrane efflux protein [Legionella steigerwaltii]|uniref:Outer membrane efflux protein n=1 Tax=Legionella steigerwaltii TaxID=460 RepID=A0A378L7P8_9GAMM|nr:TolC family protein [Legionella steigerwaltii]KTD80073.1 outer membrane efflux protein [Legionella steigerwaltii]STY23095.1 outer membrane efflux protein [Legionella steigerwaltii]